MDVDSGFMLERRNNYPVEALLGYVFAQERLLSHVLFMALMIIKLVVLINGPQWATSNAPPLWLRNKSLT